jgi:hypothetical protein
MTLEIAPAIISTDEHHGRQPSQRNHAMGTLLRFPIVSPIKRDTHFRNLLQAVADFIDQLKSAREAADESLWNSAKAPLMAALDGLETTLADIDAIGYLLPPGEFKTQFDFDRRALAVQVSLAKGTLVGLAAQTDLGGHKSP